MRQLLACATIIALGLVSGQAQDQPQRFRSKVDLLTVDVAAVDSRGKPVEDMHPGDFVVKVDGKPRTVVSAQLIKVDRQQSVETARPADRISTNVSPEHARRIIVAVDQTLITPGQLTPLLRTASGFVERLAPADYAAFIGFPAPGPRVDFTTDKAAVRKALQTISIGQPAKNSPNNFNISLFEAFTITGPEDIRNKVTGPQSPPPGPVMQRVMERECQDLPADQCKRQIYNESGVIAAEARLEGKISLQALEALLKDLVPLDGPKSMVVFSAGMVAEDPSVFEELARLAAAARTTINVIAVERDRGALISEKSTLLSSPLMDRSYEMQGLESVADRTNGTLFRGIAAGAGIFERLESELSAWYLVAVERQPGDPEGQRIEVNVTRRGVSVKSNKTVVTGGFNTQRPVADLLSEVLSSPFAMPGIPLRVSTFNQRDAAGDTYRLRLAAQIGQPGEPAGEFALGYVLTDEGGRVQAKAGSLRTLSPSFSGPNQTLQYDTALSVAPGTYSLRFGVVDKEGRRGTVVHRLELPTFEAGALATSDLIVGNLPVEGESLTPRVEPQVTTSEVAGYLELYVPETSRDELSVVFEIAEGESSPALVAKILTLRPGETPHSRVATGFVTATITPGRYLARAVVRRDGVPIRTLTRSLSIVRDPASCRTPTRSRGISMSPELRYSNMPFSGLVNGLANIVAQEEFTLSKPDRRVTSDLLLVRYPGSQRDLILYRDVVPVDAKALPGREARLLELFVKPTGDLRERARQIMNGTDQFVPSVFNPIYVIGFLQSDFQSRFELTVNDAGADWPREVKAVTFVDVGRPTMLRTGTFGDIDVPTRGTAWIEEGTGRVLQTELQVGRGRSLPTMVTKFRLDDRLQVMVPVEMRTENPDGLLGDLQQFPPL